MDHELRKRGTGISIRSRERAGIALALVTAAAFALSNASASLAYQGGSNPLTVAAFRFIPPAVALIVWLGAGGVSLALPARDGWIAAAKKLVEAAAA